MSQTSQYFRGMRRTRLTRRPSLDLGLKALTPNQQHFSETKLTKRLVRSLEVSLCLADRKHHRRTKRARLRESGFLVSKLSKSKVCQTQSQWLHHLRQTSHSLARTIPPEAKIRLLALQGLRLRCLVILLRRILDQMVRSQLWKVCSVVHQVKSLQWLADFCRTCLKQRHLGKWI